ncbi:type I-E CRISPR-associated endonuclease Cas1e [Thermus thermamylovorans]|uniref:CRISPR-associated endonuclease Cas1 n=1 Tax=Thermus thermamylovorans TaxID=2509362 RepID=A0A4Q9AVG0_9DEIN|nr:type I-E CRISPR-associated endonuclease Cas1e [Thermus thermamylovorans]TBH14959.1 type I-E CRISPR-associated endonuclease Cas1 [Thermus thermamylovorans]
MPPVPPARNLKELPKFRDGLSYLYVEHAFIEQEAQGIGIYDREGLTLVPVAALGVLFLGPGTRITHAAIRALAGNGCTVCWVGEGYARFYAQGLGDTRSALRLQRQARAWADPGLHLEVVYRLYEKRFQEPLPRDFSLEQVRGLEGVRVRAAYARWSRETGVPWKGRSYDRRDWAASDPVNRALSAGAAYLYGLAHAAIVSAGFSPALGFIHTGKLLSFVYDVADLYKTEVLVPAAFLAAAEGDLEVERRVRHRLREQIQEARLLERMVEDLLDLFQGLGLPEEAKEEEEDPTRPGGLWDPEGEVEGGVAYGGDGPGEGAEELEG